MAPSKLSALCLGSGGHYCDDGGAYADADGGAVADSGDDVIIVK